MHPDADTQEMKMKRRNEKTRLLLTLELAVILPAAALVILSAWHVQHIQRDRAVEAAIQRDFSQVLAISEKQINHKAYELVDDVRTEFPAPSEACASDAGQDSGRASLRRARLHVFPGDRNGVSFSIRPVEEGTADFATRPTT